MTLGGLRWRWREMEVKPLEVNSKWKKRKGESLASQVIVAPQVEYFSG
jgi:hypothetical protein